MAIDLARGPTVRLRTEDFIEHFSLSVPLGLRLNANSTQ
jgi:hypothetical protein